MLLETLSKIKKQRGVSHIVLERQKYEELLFVYILLVLNSICFIQNRNSRLDNNYGVNLFTVM